MRNRRLVRPSWSICIVLALGAATSAGAGTVLTGEAAMGDWTSDQPGVRRKITVQDLPQPSSNILAINRARVVDRPANAQPRVPPGFKVEFTPAVSVIRVFCSPPPMATSSS